MNFNPEYTREGIIRMKRYTYALKCNLAFNFQGSQKDVFGSLQLLYPAISQQTNSDVVPEYGRVGLYVTTKPIILFDSVDISIWTDCYIANLNREIGAYECRHGVVDLELSKEFDDFINNRNNVIDQEKLYVKEKRVLGLSQIIDTVANVTEIASAFSKRDVPYLDEALLGLKGISYALKKRNGIVTDKDKVGAGLDLMSYVAVKSSQDEDIKKALKVTPGVIGLCLEFFIGNK